MAQTAGTLPGGLKKLQRLLHKGLDETAALWPPVRAAYRWVHRVARVLKNEAELPARKVRRRLSAILARMRQAARQTQGQAVAGQLRHFVKVTKRWWSGLFACYQSADLPRTNNDLEHLFGSHRYHERRASGRKVASPGLVVMGAARVVAALATRHRPEEGLRLPAGYVPQWQQARAELEKRREGQRQRRRFRRDPDAYLKNLEELLLQLRLPP